MNTEFGKWLKTFRIMLGIKLYDMSKTLELSSSFLSAIETGKKSIPVNFIDRLVKHYPLSKEQISALENAIEKTREEELKNKDKVRIKIDVPNTEIQSLAYSFARKINELTDEQQKAIKEILENKTDD